MKKRIIFYILLAASVVLIFLSQKLAPSLKSVTITDCFDTVTEITVYSRSEKPIKDCEKYLYSAEKMFSATNPEAEIYRLNHGENVDLSDDTKEIIELGKTFTKHNSEYFSIYLNPLSEAWDIKNNSGVIPDITDAMQEVREKKSINLGAVAKGYAADKLCSILRKDGITSAMLSLGGNAYAIGKKPTGESWKIGIQSPKDESKIVGIISAENLAVVTSGDYQRYFELNGVRYHHIFDPKTGYPATNGLHSVTVIGENAALCDALATTAFVAGLKDGQELLKKYNVRGIFITDDTVYFSKSLENIFKQTDFSYKYEFIY
ncbi:MAG: FAD:protein FMN transferase [Clostridiales bacterium]|nr:FAD:protein FMN transferase [Clostridiales bacterium]